jgi:hypothetical protein
MGAVTVRSIARVNGASITVIAILLGRLATKDGIATGSVAKVAGRRAARGDFGAVISTSGTRAEIRSASGVVRTAGS